MPSSQKTESPEFAEAVRVVEAAQRNTRPDQLIREFGEDRVTEDANGEYVLRLKGKREIQKFDEMDRPRKRADAERGEKAAERMAATHVTIRGVRGKVQVPERHAETAERIAHFRRTGKW